MSLKSSIKTVITLGQGLAGGLPEAADDADPIELFEDWYEAARASGILLPESVALATSTPEGVPSARMVLLKGVDARGFVFFTNYASQKAREIEANPLAALCFATRGRGSQIGAWASMQSERLTSREELERRADEAEARFADGDVPLPPFWGGYRLEPARIEFWQGRANRLHDRLAFLREGDGWTTRRLYP
jgi:pyridoxamine 5'-phosphate oxidase